MQSTTTELSSEVQISGRVSGLALLLHRRGIYYGWVVLLAGTVGVIMSVPGQTMGVSVYTDFLLPSLGLSRTELSMAYMFGTLMSAFLLPLVGRLMDRVGTRIVAVVASICLSFFLLVLAGSPSITRSIGSATHWRHEWVALSVAFIGFLGIRHFGQGQLTMASRTMMGRWFEKRRGLMLGISGFFVAFGFGVAPLVLTWLISKFHWQGSLLVLAAMLWGMALFAWATFRQSPEESGLVIDGGRPSNTRAGVLTSETVCYTASQAKRTLAFWVFNFGMVAQALLVTAVTFHMGRIGQLNHMTSIKAFSVFLPIGIVSTSSELLGGLISDKIQMKYLLAVMQLGICCGLLGLQSYGTDWGFALTALGFGISNGLFSLLMGAAWPKLFGRKHLGAIAGLTMSWLVAGSAVGPYAFSLGESFSGNYRHVLYWSLLIPATVFAASFFANQPRSRTEEAAG